VRGGKWKDHSSSCDIHKTTYEIGGPEKESGRAQKIALHTHSGTPAGVREQKLRQPLVSKKSPLVGKSLKKREGKSGLAYIFHHQDFLQQKGSGGKLGLAQGSFENIGQRRAPEEKVGGGNGNHFPKLNDAATHRSRRATTRKETLSCTEAEKKEPARQKEGGWDEDVASKPASFFLLIAGRGGTRKERTIGHS